nr:PREDICTED: uncharacterized protein LOC109032401 isoform X2 [Bemisia tabaci]
MIAVKILIVSGLLIMGPELCQQTKPHDSPPPKRPSPDRHHISTEHGPRHPPPQSPANHRNEHLVARSHKDHPSHSRPLSPSPIGGRANHRPPPKKYVQKQPAPDHHNPQKVNIRPTDGGVTTRSDSDSDPENPENKVKKNSEGKLGAVPSDLGHSSSVSSAYSTGLTPSSSMGSTTSTGSEDTSWDFGKRGKPVGKSMRTNRKSKEWWEQSRSFSLSSDSSSLDLPTKEERPSSPKSPDRISDVETSSTEPAKKRPGKSVRTRNSKEYWDKASMSSLSSDSSPFSSFRSEPSSFSDFSSVPSSPRESSEPSSPKKKEELSAEAKCHLKCLNKEGWVDGGEEYENAQLPVKDGFLVDEDGVPTCKCRFNSQFMFFLTGRGLNVTAYRELEGQDPVGAREWLGEHGVKVHLLHTKRQMSRSPPVKMADLPPALLEGKKPQSASKNEPESSSKNEPVSAYRKPDNCTDMCRMEFAFIKLNETELKANDIPYPGLYITTPVNASAPVPDCTCKINPRLLKYLRVKGHNETEFVEAHGLHNEHPWTGRVWLGTKPRGFRVLFHDAPERVKGPATPEKETGTAPAKPGKGKFTAPAKPPPASFSTTPGKKGT